MIFKTILIIFTVLLLLVFGIVDITDTKLNRKSVIISLLVVAVYGVLLSCKSLGKTSTEKTQRVIGGLVFIGYLLKAVNRMF